MKLAELVDQLGALADQPSDDDELRLQHRFLIGTGVVMSIGGIMWGVLAGVLGLWWQSLIPFGYTMATATNMAFLARTKRFKASRSVQVTLSLILPFVFQWSLGGWYSSGATMLWALLTLNASQSFGARRTSIRWLVLFVALVVVSAAIDAQLTVPERLDSDTLTGVLFTVNVTAVSLAIFALVSYFLHLRQQTADELARRNIEIEESQRALVQSEKLAVIGRLSAGMAHELNNPAAAATRGAKHLLENMRRGRHTSAELAVISLDQTQVDRIWKLGRQVRQSVHEPENLDNLERADLELQIEEWCDSVQLSSAPDPALMLDAGLRPQTLDELALHFSPDGLSLVVRVLTEFHERELLAEQVSQGAQRISELVGALKSYTHMGRAGGQVVDVNAGLNDTLVMMQGELKRGVEVHRELDPDLPCIEANGGELNQVWTNLIDNAVDAMEGSGRLDVSSRRVGNEVLVTIGDDGPGIPPKIREQLFDPFVTSKPVGVGTGLGLNISRNIVVERHGGSIEIDSDGGGTTATVRLPLREVDWPTDTGQSARDEE